MTRRYLKYWLAIFLLVFQFSASAEDIDLFVRPPPSSTGDLPNLLIVLDNTANWSTAFTNEIATLVSTFNNLPVNTDSSAKFRVGVMMFTESGGSNSGADGGYVRAAVRDMTAGSSGNKELYAAMLNKLDVNGDKSNGGKLGMTMAEIYAYFSGGHPVTGNNKVKADYQGNTSGNAESNAVYAIPYEDPNKNALESKAAGDYRSPGAGCRNFIIYISNGPVQDNSSDTTTATNALKDAAGSGAAGTTATTAIQISPSGSQYNVGDEWARFMKKSSLGIVTYAIDALDQTTGQSASWSALLKSMAAVGGGKYFPVKAGSGSQLGDAINTILSEIQSVNSVFASVSLPVSVNTQGTYRNQVYIGMFRPDQYTRPRWTGNLKQYKLGYINNVLKLQDADSKSAINSNTGFITECARSFWTPTAADTYWSFNPQGGCLAPAGSDNSNSPDGNIVEKGAQAFVLRLGTPTRTVKTCSATFGSCAALTDFNSTNVTQAMLGATSIAERDAIIDWTKGINNNGLIPDEYGGAIAASAIRPDVHGDVVHSRPVAINFGTDTAPQVVVFYGGNDGVLRAVNGNRSEAIGAAPAGSELWAFVAPEFYGNLKRLRDNTPSLSFTGSTVTTSEPKPYAIDGPIAAYRDASRTWIYASMRRGGRVLYGFDVTTPASPSLKWKVGCPNPDNDTDCSSGFSGLGQTWSSPKALKAAGYASGAAGTEKPMLIMGGGYDACEDADDVSTCTPTKGNRIYVLDADTAGAPLKTFDTERGVIADVIVVPDSSGLAKYAYAADLGGNVYRISGIDANSPIGSTPPAAWTITRIASLGCDTSAGCGASTSNRKFMFAPDVVEDSGTFTLLLGSGDREKPLDSFYFPATNGVSNYFFMFKDKPSDTSWLTSESGNCGGVNLICLASLVGITTSATPTASDLAAKKGWYLGLRAGEQVVTSAITIFNVANFSTHMPASVASSGSCSSNLGTASIYNIDYNNAASTNGTSERMGAVSGGGLPPSPTAGMVTLDDGTSVPFCIGCSANSPLEGSIPQPPFTTIQPKARVYWYIQK